MITNKGDPNNNNQPPPLPKQHLPKSTRLDLKPTQKQLKAEGLQKANDPKIELKQRPSLPVKQYKHQVDVSDLLSCVVFISKNFRNFKED